MKLLNSVPLADALNELTRNPALVIGPEVTCPPGEFRRQIQGLIAKYSKELGQSEFNDFREAVDYIRQNSPEAAVRLETDLRQHFGTMRPNLEVPHLAKVNWAAVISLTSDLCFESAMSDKLDEIASSVTITLLVHPTDIPPQRTIPVYKLCGNPRDSEPKHTLALGKSDLLMRQAYWPSLLSQFPDYIRGAPVLFAGSSSEPECVRALLSTLASMAPPRVNKLIFFSDDPILHDPTVAALSSRFSISVIDSSVRDFCGMAAERHDEISGRFAAKKNGTPNGDIYGALRNYVHLISVVPPAGSQNISVSRHRHALMDGLFRPCSIDWDPFLQDLDLRRSVTDDIHAEVSLALESAAKGVPGCVIIHGEAGVGKTTTLKRVAIETAKRGLHTIWCRRSASGAPLGQYRKLAKDLNDWLEKSRQDDVPIAVFCDDPWALRLEIGDLISCFSGVKSKIVFVCTFRNSSYFTQDRIDVLSHQLPIREVEIPYELRDEELPLLAKMLVSIGVVNSEEEANAEISAIPSLHADDILCSLWYLIPETQNQITDSLRDEYSRLGGAQASISIYARQAQEGHEVACLAYECAAVTSGLGIDLPIEVLVRSLKIDYDDWSAMTVSGQPLWGLLYDDTDYEGITVVYRTRNEIVTRVLLDLVNGGVGHAGEFRILKRLISACFEGGAVYRKFLVDTLVRNRLRLEKILTYEQGIELFDLAENVGEFEDRLLAHHKGVWMHHMGRKYRTAYLQLEKALTTSQHPASDRDAPIEHIHASMAAAVVQMVSQGEQDRGTGLEMTKEHLRLACPPGFFNAHTSHISANLLFELAQLDASNNLDEVALDSISSALYEIERALQLIGSQGFQDPRLANSCDALSDLRNRILGSVADIEALKKFALDHYRQSDSQAGFQVAARKMLAEACISDKGTHYNEVNEYLKECFEEINHGSGKVSIELIAIRSDLLIRWRIQKPRGAIDWNQLRNDLEAVLLSAQYRNNVAKKFYLAVALFHCNEIPTAQTLFAQISKERIPGLKSNKFRSYYLGPEGFPKRFQCRVDKRHGRYYGEVIELNTDLPFASSHDIGGSGSTIHAYIAFSFSGPVAILHKPQDVDRLLP